MITHLLNKLERNFFTRAQQQAFLEDIAALVVDGVPANQALETVREIARGTSQTVAEDISCKLAEGKQIADGMSGWFPQTIVEIVRAGEAGGSLADNLDAAVRALSQDAKATTQLISSTAYPLIVIAMGVFVAVYIRHSVFENYASIKPIALWPSNGRLLVTLADFFQHWWWMVIISGLTCVMGGFYFLQNYKGNQRKRIDMLPPFKLYRDITGARFMETIGLLLCNGVMLKRAMMIMRQHATPYLAWHILKMEQRLSDGRENIAEVLDSGLIHEANILRLKVIAKGKGFPHALVRLGQLAHQNNTKRLVNLAKLTGGILLAIGACFAAFMIFAVYGVGAFVGS